MGLRPLGGGGGGSTSSGSVLNGEGPPPSGSGLDPLDGVNDPWRTSPLWGPNYLLGPLYEVTWEAGDVLLAAVTAAEQDAIAVGLQRSFYPLGSTMQNLYNDPQLVAIEDAFLSPGNPSRADYVATEGGHALYYLQQLNFGGAYTFDPSIDPLFGLGSDVAVVGPYELPDEMIGVDGQWYVDLDSRDVYGPRTDGVWTKFSTLPAPE